MNLNEICGYLPYKPKAICNDDGEIKEFTLSRCIMMERGEFTYKLILHPLSDLVKPVLTDGKIPMQVICSKFGYKEQYPKDWTFWHKDGVYFVKAQDPIMTRLFYFNSKSKSFHLSNPQDRESGYDVNQLDAFNWLYEHHFDIHGLIEKGEAIDINTI